MTYIDDFGFPVHIDVGEVDVWDAVPDRDLEPSDDRLRDDRAWDCGTGDPLLDAPTTDLFGRDYNRHYYGGTN